MAEGKEPNFLHQDKSTRHLGVDLAVAAFGSHFRREFLAWLSVPKVPVPSFHETPVGMVSGPGGSGS